VRRGHGLDVGYRDGHLACLLADRYRHVTALDLAPFDLADKRISWHHRRRQKLAFADSSFDLVICAEVLEHISASDLEAACGELVRVTRRHLLIGVPTGRTSGSVARLASVAEPTIHLRVTSTSSMNRGFTGCSPA
jgi:2-polyprenyl-3-methyl-5-hydroxy-6-metoxy-1,4-benzoquinol methylase